jgi:hypothetical protein
LKPAVVVLVLILCGQAGAAPLRDPFVRPGTPAAAGAAPAGDGPGEAAAAAARPEPPAPRLRAILYSRAEALADIDGLVLREGDRAGNWRVVRIEERRVTLKRGATSLVLQLDRETAR